MCQLVSLGSSRASPSASGQPLTSAPGLCRKVAENPIEVHWLRWGPCGLGGALQGAPGAVGLGERQRAGGGPGEQG